MTNARNLTALRELLFQTIEGVKAGTLDADKARAINAVAGSLIDTARVEIDFLRQAGEQSRGTGFLTASEGDGGTHTDKGDDGQPAQRNGITAVTRHLLKG